MNDDRLYAKLCEQSWRRPLTEAETAELDAWLATHPEARLDWEAEACLNGALGSLSNVPVPSNFTAQVMQTIEREAAADLRQRQRTGWRLWHRWMPRVAFATFLVGAGLFSYHRAIEVRHQRFVKGVIVISDVASMPSPKILADFDAIRVLGRVPPPDEELLALLQ